MLISLLFYTRLVLCYKLTPNYTDKGPSGILNINKPRNMTSTEVCNYIKNLFHNNGFKDIKIGHGGTLDKFAEGVLPIGIGTATKMLTSYLSGNKEYMATGEFGYETDTLEITGNKQFYGRTDINYDELDETIKSFEGTFLQDPPIYSAKKIKTVRASTLTRLGIPVTLEKVKVTIHSITRLPKELPKFSLLVSCSKGTYMRSLIKDIAHKLNTYATCTELIRTKCGPLSLSDSVQLDSLDTQNIERHLHH